MYMGGEGGTTVMSRFLGSMSRGRYREHRLLGERRCRNTHSLVLITGLTIIVIIPFLKYKMGRECSILVHILNSS